MKKLMIAAAIVCAAVISQAATTTWRFTTPDVINDGTTSGFAEGAQAYVVLYGADYGKSDIGLSQDALLTAIRNKQEIPSAYALGGVTVGADGKIAATGVTFDDSWNEDGYVGAYLAVIASDKIYLGAEDWYPEGSLVQGYDGDLPMGTLATSKMIDTTGSAGFSQAGWYSTSAVPEPTSGLLLLLGVAGLALRRRRA